MVVGTVRRVVVPPVVIVDTASVVTVVGDAPAPDAAAAEVAGRGEFAATESSSQFRVQHEPRSAWGFT